MMYSKTGQKIIAFLEKNLETELTKEDWQTIGYAITQYWGEMEEQNEQGEVDECPKCGFNKRSNQLTDTSTQPESEKEKSIKTLQNAGILNEKGELDESYKPQPESDEDGTTTSCMMCGKKKSCKCYELGDHNRPQPESETFKAIADHAKAITDLIKGHN